MSYKVIKRGRERVCGFLLYEAAALSSGVQMSAGRGSWRRDGGVRGGLDLFRGPDGGIWLCFCRGGGSRRSGSGGRELRVKHNLDGWEWSLLFKALERAGLAEVASGMSEGTTGHLRGY